MAKEYRVPKMVHRIMLWLAQLGVGRAVSLTTTGRRTGKSRSVPVAPITLEGVEYLVAPYGPVGWVQNIRADPRATLRSGGTTRRVRLDEVTGDAAEVVQAYHEREPFARRYMEVPAAGSVEDFAMAAGRFPVFRIDDII